MTTAELARDAAACVRAGADAIHMHPRDGAGAESLDPPLIDEAVEVVRASARVPLGVATGAWVEPDPARRADLVSRWTAPDYASVNLCEPGAPEVMNALSTAGIGIEAGIWSVRDVERLVETGLGDAVLRILVEVIDTARDQAEELIDAIDAALDRAGVAAPRLYHGEDGTAWPVLHRALALGRDVRAGLEDTLLDPNGDVVAGNAALIETVVSMRERA